MESHEHGHVRLPCAHWRLVNLQVPVTERLRLVTDSRKPTLVLNSVPSNREEKEGLVSGPIFEKMKIATVVDTYEPYPTIFPPSTLICRHSR